MFRPLLRLAVAAAVAAPLVAAPAAAQTRERRSGGVSITIQKAPSYLNTRTVARPNTRASYDTSAVYQSSTPTRGGGFQRWPLPSTFDLPGY